MWCNVVKCGGCGVVMVVSRACVCVAFFVLGIVMLGGGVRSVVWCLFVVVLQSVLILLFVLYLSCSDWPTIPQLYVNKEFIGGCDIVTTMFREGELESLFKGLNLIEDATKEEGSK